MHLQSNLDQIFDRVFGKNGDQAMTVRNLCYTVFMAAKGPSKEDGGPTDWFTDTLPIVEEGIARLRKALLDELNALGAAQAASEDRSMVSGTAWPVRPSGADQPGLFEVQLPEGNWIPVVAITNEHARRIAAHDWNEKHEKMARVAAE